MPPRLGRTRTARARRARTPRAGAPLVALLFLALAAGALAAAAPEPVERDPVALRAALEREIDDKVARVLAPLVGEDRFVVRTSVDVDLQKVLRHEKSYDPDSAVVVSEQRAKERRPGTDESDADLPARQDRATSYEYSVRELSVEQPVGRLRRLSVVVLLDRREPGEPESAVPARSEEELARIEELIKGAIGFDEERGDRLTVEEVVFRDPAASAGGGSGLRPPHVLALLGGLVALAATVALLRRRSPAALAASRAAQGPGADRLAGSALEQLGHPAPIDVLRRRLAAVAVEQPQAVAQTLRLWLHESRGEG